MVSSLPNAIITLLSSLTHLRNESDELAQLDKTLETMMTKTRKMNEDMTSFRRMRENKSTPKKEDAKD